MAVRALGYRAHERRLLNIPGKHDDILPRLHISADTDRNLRQSLRQGIRHRLILSIRAPQRNSISPAAHQHQTN